jgi:hypothetical protein
MKPFLPAAAVVAALVSAGTGTDYTAKRALAMVAHTSLEMESTTRMEVDGQPIDRAGGDVVFDPSRAALLRFLDQVPADRVYVDRDAALDALDHHR